MVRETWLDNPIEVVVLYWVFPRDWRGDGASFCWLWKLHLEHQWGDRQQRRKVGFWGCAWREGVTGRKLLTFSLSASVWQIWGAPSEEEGNPGWHPLSAFLLSLSPSPSQGLGTDLQSVIVCFSSGQIRPCPCPRNEASGGCWGLSGLCVGWLEWCAPAPWCSGFFPGLLWGA